MSDDIGGNTDYLRCMATNDRSSDIQGFAVRLAALVSHICIAILIAWSDPSSVKSAVDVLLLQNFTILVCSVITLIVGGGTRISLSQADAHFVLVLTITPVSLYLIYSSIFRFLLKRPNRLFKSLEPAARYITCVSAITMLIWWVVYTIVLYSSTIFEKCRPSPRGWLTYKKFTTLDNLSVVIYFVLLIPFMWIVYFIRHFTDIREEYKRHVWKEKDIPTWTQGNFGRVQQFGRAIKSFIISQWVVIKLSHPWLFPYTIIICFLIWGALLLIFKFDTRWYYYRVLQDLGQAKEGDKPGGGEGFAVLSYGQLLAIAVAIDPVLSTLKLAYSRRRDVVALLRRCPRSVRNDVVFVVTGHQNPWKEVQEEKKKRRDNMGDDPDTSHDEQLALPTFVRVEEPRYGKVDNLQGSRQECHSDESSVHGHNLEGAQMPRAYRP
ncbi:hypothetical protein PM082_006795 [Marasmius tenuissimus]|nr:hypothetical protein PM082_006795 [Marasmius tenuissimus]